MFTVVITTKDRKSYLLRAVQSIVNSSILPYDIVIVNDGGIEIAEQDLPPSSIKYIIINNKASKGANYSRNLGIDTAETNLIFLLDDDDAFYPHTFKKRLDLINKNPDVGIVFTGIDIVSSKNLTKISRKVKCKSDVVTQSDLLKSGNLIGSTSRALIRKEIFESAGRFDVNLKCLQDYDLWIRMSSLSKVLNDHDYGVLYTVHEDGKQISSNYCRYLEAGNYLLNKYNQYIDGKLKRAFKANIYLRVAISASSSSEKDKIKYGFLSLINNFSLKASVLCLIPGKIIKKFYKYA
ncbi:UDP-Gal:alpha-D-GlcNAc-diphosphoundecaprenol beta-1,3-galactosyltransferase [Enterobacter cloacae]|uniref:glycosyltransferase family 2 protein n=2 Tax=Enterobacter hormaechei TaxID=158836 RepID=UPI0007351ADD|nr:glycosyltransferase family 2 protein [Enterobacter hormaechei]CAA2951432.1 UDP-Gal:alpha-D-GlcNAc-diphosphoundecaprenol beta-1,3-galactosyltransferase [Enterobacter cloacae]HAS1741810.1 glycosyltransferase family 2 protein [Enterobacter hormaechei subsp. oharae]KTH02219.1 glycosyl transferase family 2 [Enterobacter hormaechei subsp. xiangfangensis]KTH09978.1 glycosyl transferase family 2 [Enterobacter hormaechei subsp. xiangfangensis]KTH24020.1 glycosyl transferase family 2 [Enterobacter ho